MGWSREGDARRATVSFAVVAPFIKIRHLRVTDLAVVGLFWPFAGGGGPAGAATLETQASPFLL